MTGTKAKLTRRGFIGSATAGLGFAAGAPWASEPEGARANPVSKSQRLPREVWIATIALDNINGSSHEEVIRKVLGRMEEVVAYEPDVICRFNCPVCRSYRYRCPQSSRWENQMTSSVAVSTCQFTRLKPDSKKVSTVSAMTSRTAPVSGSAMRS